MSNKYFLYVLHWTNGHCQYFGLCPHLESITQLRKSAAGPLRSRRFRETPPARACLFLATRQRIFIVAGARHSGSRRHLQSLVLNWRPKDFYKSYTEFKQTILLYNDVLISITHFKSCVFMSTYLELKSDHQRSYKKKLPSTRLFPTCQQPKLPVTWKSFKIQCLVRFQKCLRISSTTWLPIESFINFYDLYTDCICNDF